MLIMSICASGQSKIKRLYERADSLLQTRYERVTYDTQYISRPDRKWMFRVRGNVSGTAFRYKNEEGGNNSHAHISTDPRGTISLGASYRGIAASFSINPGKISGRNNDYEFSVSASSNRYIIDANYQRSYTLSGDITTRNGTFHLNKDYLKMELTNITGYYIFNHRRFSYPAAFSQSYFQKRSAGSWLAGISYVGGKIYTSEDAPPGSHCVYINVRNVGIGGGYGYNLVHRKWLFHLSLMPTIVFYNYNNITMDDVRVNEYTHFPDLIVNSRAAIIYNISPRYFVGATCIANSSTFGKFEHFTRQTRWRARAFFGFRL